MLKRVQSVYYTVKDMDRAVSFYEGVFGLKLKFRDGARWAQFDGGNVSFALSSPEESASLEGGAVAALDRAMRSSLWASTRPGVKPSIIRLAG